MKMSTLLVPTSKNNPAKVKDPGLIQMARAGYAAFDAANDEILLLPLGVVSLGNLTDLMEEVFYGQGIQSVDSTALGGTTGLAVASRVLKQEDQLPMAFSEREGRNFFLTGLTSEPAAAEGIMEELLTAFTEQFEARGLETAVIWTDSGLTLAVPATGKVRRGIDGLICENCGWAGTGETPVSACGCGDDQPSPEPFEEVLTPGANTIAELCRQLGVDADQTMKTMFYAAISGEEKEIVVALMRGDRKISPVKLAAHLGADEVRFATPVELHETIGSQGGYLGPVGLPETVRIVADLSVEGCVNLVVGANKPDYHAKGACWGRDFTATSVTDLLALEAGGPCPACGKTLEESAWRPLLTLRAGHPAQDRFDSLDYRDAEHKKQIPAIWSGSLDMEALLLALFEIEGKQLPPDLAPFEVQIAFDGEPGSPSAATAEELYLHLAGHGVMTLLDDRFAKTSTRTHDLDVMRIPVRVWLTDESIAEERVEVRFPEEEPQTTELADAAHMILAAFMEDHDEEHEEE